MAQERVVLKHRAIFDVHPLNEDGDACRAVAQAVVDWLVEKESRFGSSPIADDLAGRRAFPKAWDYCNPREYRGGDYDADEWPALACASFDDEDGELHRWVMEYDEPDAGHDDRRWHTTVCLTRSGEASCHVAMETTCRPTRELAEPLPETVAAPSLLRSIICLPWFASKVGPTLLQAVPNKVSAQSFDDFAQALTDPERTLPLVLFCTGYDGKMPEQAKQLARRALGLANVYVIDWSNDELREKEQALFERGTAAGEYACPKSSCRMYVAGVDLTNHNASRQHESWNRAALDAVRPSQFAETIARRLIANEKVPTIAMCESGELDASQADAAQSQDAPAYDEYGAAGMDDEYDEYGY